MKFPEFLTEPVQTADVETAVALVVVDEFEYGGATVVYLGAKVELVKGSGSRLMVERRECLTEGGPNGIAWAGRVVLEAVTVILDGIKEVEVEVGMVVSSQLDETRLSTAMVGMAENVGRGGSDGIPMVKLELGPGLELTGVDVAGEPPS